MTDSATPTDSTRRLNNAETALQCCTNRRETMAAIREYFAAKAKGKSSSAAEADR
jgi:hypothetical protein